MNGIKRGLFSNEAGEGSAPNVAATASTSHPVKQGLIQALGVFTDTLVVCSCTAFIILFSGVDTQGGLNGIALTQAAIRSSTATRRPSSTSTAGNETIARRESVSGRRPRGGTSSAGRRWSS